MSRLVPGVRGAEIVPPGHIGCLPNQDCVERANTREADLIATTPRRAPPLATAPNAETALMGQLTGRKSQGAAKEAWRTVPPREHGGNCDIKNLSRGSRVYFPVYMKGAGLSMGDIHWSQGDGEITFCGAIEMAGYIDIGVDVIKGGVAKYGIINPVFQPSPIEPRYSEYLVFEGISVDEKSGKQIYLDSHVAYRRACLHAVERLNKFGFTS